MTLRVYVCESCSLRVGHEKGEWLGDHCRLRCLDCGERLRRDFTADEPAERDTSFGPDPWG